MTVVDLAMHRRRIDAEFSQQVVCLCQTTCLTVLASSSSATSGLFHLSPAAQDHPSRTDQIHDTQYEPTKWQFTSSEADILPAVNIVTMC